jgi:hypothetical protein
MVPRTQAVPAATTSSVVMQADSQGQPLLSTVITEVPVAMSAVLPSLWPLLPAVPVIQALAVTSANITNTSDGPEKPADTTLTCDLCSTTLKSKAALTKHRVLLSCLLLFNFRICLIRTVPSVRN